MPRGAHSDSSKHSATTSTLPSWLGELAAELQGRRSRHPLHLRGSTPRRSALAFAGPASYLSSEVLPDWHSCHENKCSRGTSPPLQHQGKAPWAASPRPPAAAGAPASARCTRSGCPGTSAPWPGLRRPPAPASASGLWRGRTKGVSTARPPPCQHPAWLCCPLAGQSSPQLVWAGQRCSRPPRPSPVGTFF